MIEIKVIGNKAGMVISYDELLKIKRKLAYLINDELGQFVEMMHSRDRNRVVTLISNAIRKEIEKYISHDYKELIRFIASFSYNESISSVLCCDIIELCKNNKNKLCDMEKLFIKVVSKGIDKTVLVVIRESDGMVALGERISSGAYAILNKIEYSYYQHLNYDKACHDAIDAEKNRLHLLIEAGSSAKELSEWLICWTFNQKYRYITKVLELFQNSCQKLQLNSELVVWDRMICDEYVMKLQKKVNEKLLAISSLYDGEMLLSLKMAESMHTMFNGQKKKKHDKRAEQTVSGK